MARGPALPDLAALIDVVRGIPGGASVEQIERRTKTPRRTLQRHLATLVAACHLDATGIRKNRRYHVPGAAAAANDAELAVSTEGTAVRRLICRPLIARTPVGYEPRFLESYRANTDHYLPAATRTPLHALGRAPGPERPPGTFARQLLGRLLVG